MKSKVLALLLMGCLALTACNSSSTTGTKEDATESEATETPAEETTAEEGDSEELDTTPITDDTVADKGIDAFMTLGEYKGIELTKVIYTVTDEDIDEEVQTELQNFPEELTDANATVAEGDIVNLDFSGSVDGEAFDGGTAEGRDLTIGSGTFIPGFEDQLIGWKAGQSGDINVTFPDDYQTEELQGKEAVFAITINSISRPLSEPTDEWVAANTDYKTVAEFREGIKAELETYNESTTESTMMDEAWTTVFATAKFTQYPKDLMEDTQAEMKNMYEQYAEMYGMTYDDFLSYAEITEETMEQSARNSVQNSLTLDYICEKENITEDSEVYQNQLASLLADSGYDSKEAAVEAGISEYNIKTVVQYNCVMDVIIDNAKITEETQSDDTTATE